MILKKCEVCGCNFVCRKDKIDTSRVCSLSCRGNLGGKEFWDKKHKEWRNEELPETLLKMRRSFEKFFDKTMDDNCWNWNGGTKGSNRLPYGNFTFRNKGYLAHRASYIIYKGEIPEKMWVLHTCDNAKCVNPDHLYLGTALDNQRDKLKRGRCKGERLSIEQVKEIKEKLKIGVMIKRLCEDYGVSTTTIHSIKSGKTWKDIE
jgi:hypothetical protein